MGVFTRGSGPSRTLERCRSAAKLVEALAPKVRHLSDEELRHAYAALRERHASGQPLDDLLPETYALVREAARRALGERPYDEQIVGAVALHLGTVVEMKTGEGKTLTAVLPACLHALAAGSPVHVMTANDYLVARDAASMAPVYRAVGLTVGTLAEDAVGAAAARAHRADVVYGTPAAFAYGYLRRNLMTDGTGPYDRLPGSAIVDEADLLMLDDATATPMLRGPDEPAGDRAGARVLADGMRSGVHYTVNTSQGTALLTAEGFAWLADQLGAEPASTPSGLGLLRRLDDALRAKELFVRDRDYVVRDGAVLMVDGQTRLPVLRSPGDGLDQALDAKERLRVRPERRLVGIITQHAHLRLYPRLAGLTGVVEGDADVYRDLYGLECVQVPTRLPVLRKDHGPQVHPTDAALLKAVVATVGKLHREGRPTLIGTPTARRTEEVAQLLAVADIPHEVLDAVAHGRAGRGGTPGETAYFLSCDDPVFVGSTSQRIGHKLPDGGPVGGRLMTRSLTGTLMAISAKYNQGLAASVRHLQIRDDLSAAFYTRRARVRASGVPDDEAEQLLGLALRAWAGSRGRDASGSPAPLSALYATGLTDAAITAGLAAAPASAERERFVEALVADGVRAYRARVADLSELDPSVDVADQLKRRLMLTVLDNRWCDLLRDLTDADAGARLRTVAGGDVLTEYRLAGRRLVEQMERRVWEEFFSHFFRVRVEMQDEAEKPSGS